MLIPGCLHVSIDCGDNAETNNKPITISGVVIL